MLLAGPTPTLLDVGVDVEVGEEDYEGDGIADARVVHPLGKVTVNVQRVGGMYDGHTELQL